MAKMHAQQPSPLSSTGDLGDISRVKVQMVSECSREVSLAHVSLVLMYVYVAPPTVVGA